MTTFGLHHGLHQARRPPDTASTTRHGVHKVRRSPSPAAAAAYRTRLSGSSEGLRALAALAPQLPDTACRDLLIDYACAGPGLPQRLVAEVRRIRN
ncbi:MULTISPECIES: hypothetical protein [unclassified Streptomyces]|uniref:hypothetical protein n=1 Tax=unclassified Streptomyces TaxID=2593676 RepID=UPI000F556F84|nr:MULTISPECIES: hypothetical protein [unclassified Streptomyces]MCX4771129.1 hypothetical protein [Streptomyces sp. NBC_01285]